MIKKIFNWIKRNWFSFILVLLMIGMITYHFFGTYNPPITQAVIVSPATKKKLLPNGQYAQIKVSTPGTRTVIQSGFSDDFVRDTISGVLGIKEKELLAIRQVTGTYKDSLQLVKSELDEQKKLIKTYQSKDSKGNVVGIAKITENESLVYKGNISLVNAIKKGKIDRKGIKISPDSLIFYDPTQRVTIEGSKEFIYTVPIEPRRKKLRVSLVVGIGAVVPVTVKDSKLNFKESGLGFFGGPALSYTF